ncbi:MAG: S-layer homology domain-containing protein [Clostridia bacterium]|nr:S-layer homology domain-containing protein [Clostridia bacterium]
MKKKFFSIAVISLVMTVMLAVSAFAVAVVETGVMYDGASAKKTATLALSEFPEGAYDITAVWASSSSNITLNATSGASITVTAKAAGDAMVMVNYSYKLPAAEEGGEPQVFSDTLTTNLTVNAYALSGITASVNRDYVAGQAISKNDITVKATYTDGSEDNNFTKFGHTPAVATTDGETITVTADGTEVTATFTISVSEISTKDLVKSVEIAYPTAATEFKVGDILKASDVQIQVTYLDGTKGTISLDNADVTVSGITFSNGKYTFSSDDAKTAPVLEVTYADKPKQSVTLKVVAEKESEETKTVLTAYVSKQPTKTTYKDGETFAPAGLEVTFVYTDNSVYVRKYTSTTSSSKVMKAGDTSVTVSPTDDKGNSYTLTITGITVTAAEATVNVTGLSTSSSYKHSLYTDATAKVGEELEWDDLFEYVYIKYKDSNDKTQYKKIKTDSELADWLGTSAKLYAVVDSKTGSKKDIVEEDDIDDGEVKLELCFEYGNNSKYTYEFNVKVSEIGCTVTICRSSSNSTKIGSAKTFDKLKDALKYLEDESDIIDDFGVSPTYENSFVIKIKLGDDQDLGSFEFVPDHEHAITIDLADYDLELESDWIDYEDCEDLKVTITNSENYSSSDDDDVKSKMEYSDEDVTLVVDKSAAYIFEKGKIPGIYAVTVKSGITNGKVEANKTTVNHGGDVKFTITPNSGYEISDVKVNSKSVTKDGQYDVNTKGVATYTLKKAEKDVEITATFKKTATTTTTEKEEEKKPASTTTTWTNPFMDVSANAQYYKAVEFVCSEGLFNGMTATKFEPTTTMTRAMFVTVLGRLAGINEMQYSGTSFTDVSKSDAQIAWAAPYIEWAVQKGITNGTGNGKFSPNEPITHQQMYVFMQRYADKIEGIDISTTGVTLTSIKDASQIADWAYDSVKFASKYGILITSSSKLTPADNALRCELAMLLHGFCVKVLGQ